MWWAEAGGGGGPPPFRAPRDADTVPGPEGRPCFSRLPSSATALGRGPGPTGFRQPPPCPLCLFSARALGCWELPCGGGSWGAVSQFFLSHSEVPGWLSQSGELKSGKTGPGPILAGVPVYPHASSPGRALGRGPRGLEGSFPLWAQWCHLAAALWGWAPSPPTSSLPLTLLSLPGPGLIVVEWVALGGKGWSGTGGKLCSSPEAWGLLWGWATSRALDRHLLQPHMGVVWGSVRGLSSRAGLGRAPRSSHLSSPPFLLAVPGEVPRDPALQVREPPAHPSCHVVVLRAACPGCHSRACPPRLQLLPPPHPLPLFFLFDERLFTGVGAKCGADRGSGHRAEGPRSGEVTKVWPDSRLALRGRAR